MAPEQPRARDEDAGRVAAGVAASAEGEEGAVETCAVPAPTIAPNLIGPYHLLQLIGEGGMGEVWLAEQKQPVRRRVAIKLIKAGMDTREVVARFESERQALALMDHPAIAKVFDAGSTPEGRPYFVMEYVAGMPITAYCDKHKLTTRQRMELFILVCEGVQHAHQKAIIHRDLKPSNILVSEIDGKPMPRIIDFGVAKATSQKLSAGTMYTRVGAMVGTLGYMSPEQADSQGEDIDTRTDVYSLGVVLYELLVGALPLDFNKLAWDEVLRRLRDEDAPRPSTKLGTRGELSAITAKNRSTELPALARQLRGDPDAIVLKALEKDRKRRYATPLELAADLERYLRNEPVTAHAPSAAYRARKYIRRHRLGVAVAGAGALLLVGFAVAQAVELRRIARERDRADRISDFMTDLFVVPDPSEALGKTVTAQQILDKGSKDIDTGLKDDPVLQAEMMDTMAHTYRNLGLYSSAHALYERALEIQKRVLGPQNPATLQSQYGLAWALRGENRFAEAETLIRATFDAQRQVLGPNNVSTLRSAELLGSMLSRLDRDDEAERLLRQTLDIQRRVLGPENPDTLQSMNELGVALNDEGRYAVAEKLMREALGIERRTLGPEDPVTLEPLRLLPLVLANEGQYPEAEKLAREHLAIASRVLGPAHPNTIQGAEILAGVLTAEGRFAEVGKLYRQELDFVRRAASPDNETTGEIADYVAQDLTYEGRYTEAEQLFHQTLVGRRAFGPEDLLTLQTEMGEAVNLSFEGRYDDAEKEFRKVIQLAGNGNQPKSLLGAAWEAFACGAAAAGHRDAALEYLGQAIDHGYSNPVLIRDDPELNSLHGDPRFDALLVKASQITAAKAQ
jgi:serine/threonine protein kinase/Tfp pilus assembly protein PilF